MECGSLDREEWIVLESGLEDSKTLEGIFRERDIVEWSGWGMEIEDEEKIEGRADSHALSSYIYFLTHKRASARIRAEKTPG